MCECTHLHVVWEKDGGPETSGDAAAEVDNRHGVPADVLLDVPQKEHLKHNCDEQGQDPAMGTGSEDVRDRK